MAMKTADESPSAKRWLPLEAQPDLMNQFVWGLGLPMDEAEFYDVYCFDDELLEMVPKPVLAVIFLFPVTAEVRDLPCAAIYMKWRIFGGLSNFQELLAFRAVGVREWVANIAYCDAAKKRS